MEWVGEPVVSKGVSERRFDLEVSGETVPGILWTPEDATGSRPLVLLGHGGSQHKRTPNILALARRLVRHLGYAAAAIDGPMHGERSSGEDVLAVARARGRMEEDPDETASRFRAARAEWSATIDALQQVDGVGSAPLGYWGLSMGTVIGIPFLASEPRVDAAVLGLMGLPPNAKGRAVASISIPVLFLLQWDDEVVDREAGFRLFGALASKDKTMHANPGLHSAVPAAEIQASEDFFSKRLGAKVAAPA